MHSRFLFSPRSLLLGASLSLLTLAHSPLRAQNAPANAPRTALITSLRGAELTLDVGAQQNAVRGAVYSIARNGRVQARVQIVTVRENDSQARILDAEEGFVLAVGDTVQFQSVQPVQPVPEAPAQPAPPVQPPTPVEPTVPAQPATPPVETAPVVTPPTQAPPATNPATPPAQPGVTGATTGVAGTTISATVTAIDGTKITFDAGADKGVRSGSRVAIARNGDVVGLARIVIVEPNRSTGEIIFSDSAIGGPQVGDVAPLLASSTTPTPLDPGTGLGTIPTTPILTPAPAPVVGADGIPSAPVRFETGVSNEVVPRADESYDYLAALAADKLLPREYPARLFHDEGSRRHRTEEDLTLSRAQIAQLTLGALRAASGTATSEDGEESARQIGGGAGAALLALGQIYQKELRLIGATPEELQVLGIRPASTQDGIQVAQAADATGADASGIGSGSSTSAEVTDAGGTGAEAGAASGRRRFTLGVSGQQRASLVSGGKDLGAVPFSERQGGLRTRSGYDTRTNIFGGLGENLRFFVQARGGSRSRSDEKGGLQISEAYVDYNANKLLRGLSVRLGRDELWWGPGHFGTLLLSDTSGPLNLIQTTFERGSYRVQSLYSPLDRGPQGGSRSLYGHNVSVQVGPQTRVGFAETLLAPKDRLDPLSFVAAFSPIPLFTIERLRNRNATLENGNILTEAYIETSLARGVRGTAEFLIDDLGVNASNILRDRVGTLIGAHFFTPRDPSKLGLFAEYANLQGRTYLALRSPNDSDYFYRGDPLGFPVAPSPGSAINGGAQSARLEAYWRPQARLHVGAGLELAAINTEDTFRTRQQIIRLRASYDIARNFALVARLQRTTTDSPNLLQGSRKQNLLQLEVVRTY